MLDHEIYDHIIAAIREILEKKINGQIAITRDERHIYVSIFNRGYWNYRIENVDLISWNDLNAEKIANQIISRHRSKINLTFFN